MNKLIQRCKFSFLNTVGMVSISFGWYHTLLGLSLVAAALGLVLLVQPQAERALENDERQLTQENLLRMTFLYWLVYAIAVFAQKAISPELTALIQPLRITAFFTYFLTFSSVLCLPLHYIEAQRQKLQRPLQQTGNSAVFSRFQRWNRAKKR